MRRRVSLAQFSCLQKVPPAGWTKAVWVRLKKQKHRGLHATRPALQAPPGEGPGGGTTVGDITILTPVQCLPPVRPPVRPQPPLRLVHLPEKGSWIKKLDK